jgi:8-oxo-dGTP diphosphatase
MRIVTAAAIIEGGKLLIARRAQGENMEGMWELPGGKVEPCESPIEGLRRELYEELGIKASIGDEVGRSPILSSSGTMTLIAFRAAIVSGTLKTTVHSELRWVTAEELFDFDFCPADIPIIRALALEMDEERAC